MWFFFFVYLFIYFFGCVVVVVVERNNNAKCRNSFICFVFGPAPLFLKHCGIGHLKN